MILRKIDNQWWGIPQPSHAWLSGRLARAWGNDSFTMFHPHEELILAAELHDIGWTDWEQRPEINPKTALPYNFLEMPLVKHMEIWEEGIKKAMTISRFAAWLVSCHNVYLLRLTPFDQLQAPEREAAELFLEEQGQLQKQLVASLRDSPRYRIFMEDGERMQDYRKQLRVWDYFSLVLCMGNSGEAKIPEMPGRDGESSVVVRKDTDFRYQVTPWPFRPASLKVVCEAVRLEKSSGSEYFPIKPELISLHEWELVPAL